MGTQPGQQFSGAERFGQIVVSASIQRCNFIALSTSHRQYDNGYVRPLLQQFVK
jgi:hypothetical protein